MVDLSKMTYREYYHKALKDVTTIYVVGIKRGTNPNWDRGIWRKFRLFFLNQKGELEHIFFGEEKHPEAPPHWVPRHQTRSGNWVGGYFETSTLGMDRTFEIVYGLGQWLYRDGYRFKAEFLSWE